MFLGDRKNPNQSFGNLVNSMNLFSLGPTITKKKGQKPPMTKFKLNKISKAGHPRHIPKIQYLGWKALCVMISWLKA
jgi:hypothetical protein